MNGYIIVFCLVTLLPWSGRSQQLSDAKLTRRASDTVIRTLYGKTLRDIGVITLVRIQAATTPVNSSSATSPVSSWHKQVWQIIETAELRDDNSVSIALGLLPRFALEYANGVKASVDRYSAVIAFPDGTEARYALRNDSQE